MKKTQQIVGEILLAIGVTLSIGGVASFFFDNVELRLLGNIIADTTGKIIWIVVNVLLASAGFVLFRFSKTKKAPSNHRKQE